MFWFHTKMENGLAYQCQSLSLSFLGKKFVNKCGFLYLLTTAWGLAGSKNRWSVQHDRWNWKVLMPYKIFKHSECLERLCGWCSMEYFVNRAKKRPNSWKYFKLRLKSSWRDSKFWQIKCLPAPILQLVAAFHCCFKLWTRSSENANMIFFSLKILYEWTFFYCFAGVGWFKKNKNELMKFKLDSVVGVTAIHQATTRKEKPTLSGVGASLLQSQIIQRSLELKILSVLLSYFKGTLLVNCFTIKADKTRQFCIITVSN